MVNVSETADVTISLPPFPNLHPPFAPLLVTTCVLHCSVKLGTKRGEDPSARASCGLKFVCGVGPLLYEFRRCRPSRKMNWSTCIRHTIVELFPRELTSIITCESAPRQLRRASHGGRSADWVRCGRRRNRYWFLSKRDRITRRIRQVNEFFASNSSYCHDFR